MYILRALVFLFLAQAVLAQQPTPILPDSKAPHVSGSGSACTCRRGTTKIAFESPPAGIRYYLLSGATELGRKA
jgi:hypothetical protein